MSAPAIQIDQRELELTYATALGMYRALHPFQEHPHPLDQLYLEALMAHLRDPDGSPRPAPCGDLAQLAGNVIEVLAGGLDVLPTGDELAPIHLVLR
jgi:hypothetical protein